MYRTVTINYRPCKASTSYKCRCTECGKTMSRKAVVEHTVNPWNKNEDGSVRTEIEVYRAAQAEADAKAAELNGGEVVCKTCENKPIYDHLRMLLQANPEVISDPKRDAPEYTPIFWLLEWKYIQHHHEKDPSQEFGYRFVGYTLTKKAREWGRKNGILEMAA